MKRLSCVIALLVATAASANDAIEFRCTHEDGQVTVQDVPCPSGTAQIIQRKGAASAPQVTTSADTASVPAILDSADLPANGTSQDAASSTAEGILDSDVLRVQAAAAEASPDPSKPAPPPIHRCIGTNGSQYLHEYTEAPPRCEALAITGLGGSIAPGAAASCEVHRDTCTLLEDADRCNGWQQRFRTARGRESFATADLRPAATAERQRVQAVLEASHCGVPR